MKFIAQQDQDQYTRRKKKSTNLNINQIHLHENLGQNSKFNKGTKACDTKMLMEN